MDNHWDELERRCAVHVNVDSTGGIGASVMTESAVASELAGLAADVIRAETNQAHEGKRVGRNSDMSFWGVGIPTLFGSLSHQPPSPVKMRNPLGWWWHTPHDLLDKIDPANLARDTRVFVRAIGRLLSDAVLPLDYAAHATALLKELEGPGQQAGRSHVTGGPGPCGGGPARQGGRARRRARRRERGADGGVARVGAGGLHQRRPLPPRPGAAASRLAGAGPGSRPGRGHRGGR